MPATVPPCTHEGDQSSARPAWSHLNDTFRLVFPCFVSEFPVPAVFLSSSRLLVPAAHKPLLGTQCLSYTPLIRPESGWQGCLDPGPVGQQREGTLPAGGL